MLAAVPGIIDGSQWLQQRLRHLQAELDAHPSDDQRKLIESEMASLREEAKAGRRRLGRWLLWGARPPTTD